MKIKKIVSLLLCTAFLFPLTVHAKDMQMYVGGRYVKRTVEVIGDFDMLPLLEIAEDLGFYTWFDGTKATISKNNEKYTFTLHSPAVYDRHGNEYGLDIVPRMINGKLMIPAKFFVDHLGMTYTWDDLTDTIFLNSDYTYWWLIGTKEYKVGRNRMRLLGTWLCDSYYYSNDILEFYDDGSCYYKTSYTEAYGTYEFISENKLVATFDVYNSYYGNNKYQRTENLYYQLRDDNSLIDYSYSTGSASYTIHKTYRHE